MRIALRFLSIFDRRIVTVELPKTVHESTVRYFDYEFLTATGIGH
jgi:hypothetical protein